MNTDEFADLLAYRSNIPAEAIEALAEYAEIAIFNINLKTGEIQLNNMTTKLTGYEPGELPESQNTKMMLTFEADRDIISSSMDKLMSGQTNRYHIEYRMKRKDGTLVSVSENALVVERDEDGTPTRICGLAQDLSRLRWAEENSRRVEREAQRFVNNSSYSGIAHRNRMLNATNRAASIIIGGYHQEYETVLRRSLQMLAESIEADKAYILRNTVQDDRLCFYTRAVWDKDALLERDAADSIAAYDDIYPEWKDVFDDQYSMREKTSDLPKGVRELALLSDALSVMFIPLFLQGDFFGVLGFENRDTGRPFTEDEADIMRAGALIIAASVARHETLKQLDKARADAISGSIAKGEFLSRMSHEIRTPINAIIGMTTLAKRNKGMNNIAYYLEMIDASSRQLLALINDVLDMSKIEANKLDLTNEPFDFAQLLENVTHMIRVKADEKSQALVIDSRVDFSREVIGDSLRISQVLINLLNNATKFTPEDGKITLSISETTGMPSGDHRDVISLLHVSVSDTGIGISEENQEGLFQAFEQADGGISRTYGGSGLGLSICKKLITLMGGDIWVESEEGEGANFTFEIPLVWGGLTARAEAAESGVGAYETETPDWTGRTILVAEDIEINREIVEGMLEDTGVELVMAEDGEDALEYFRHEPTRFDLILMDVQMPNMDGLTATRLIRETNVPTAAEIPILAMTANAFTDDIEACLNAGMDVHLAKPIDIDELYRTISQYIHHMQKF